MKRSEYLKLMDLVWDLRYRMVGVGFGYAYSEEAAYDEGKESAYESAAEDLELILEDVVIDVEDVVQCDGFLVDINKSRPHLLGSRPYTSLMRGYGCRECLEHVGAKA